MFRNLPGYVSNLWVVNNPHIIYRTLRGFFRGLALRKYTLRSIEIFPTMDCNIRCQMCSVDKFRAAGDRKPLSVAEYEKLAEEAAPLGLTSVTILGGEPLLVDNLEEIIAAFKRRHVYVHMVTNSTLATRERLASLKRAGLDGVCFSLDSLDKEINDAIRGFEGHHHSVFRAIDEAKSLGLVVSLAPVFFPGSVDAGIEVLRFCQRHGIGASGSQASPVGSWEGQPILSKQENDRLRELLREYPRLTFDWALSYFLKPNCPAGKEKIAITTYGDVCGCSINPISFGNIREEGLKAILTTMQAFSQVKKNSPYCLAGEDADYVERYLRPLAQFARYPVSFRDHPNIRKDTEPELFRMLPPVGARAIQLEAASCVVCGSSRSTEEAQSSDFLYHTSDQVFSFVRCADCGHLYLNPRPSAAAVSTIYPETYSSFTGKFSRPNSPIAFVKSHILQRRLRPLAELLARGGRVLDVGCGDGQLLIDIKRRYPQVDAYALDWNFSEAASERLAANGVQAYRCLVERAELPESFFDLIIMNQLLEHLWEPKTALEILRKSLKPDGLLTIETPNPDGYDRRLFRKGMWGAYYTPRHLNLFSGAHLERFLSQGGFRVIQRTNLCAPITWVYSIQSAVQKKWPWAQAAASIVRDTNLIALAPFTLLDGVVKILGGTTSNQKIIARRVP